MGTEAQLKILLIPQVDKIVPGCLLPQPLFKAMSISIEKGNIILCTKLVLFSYTLSSTQSKIIEYIPEKQWTTEIDRQVIQMEMLSDMMNVFHELKEELKNWKLSRKN